MLEITKWKVITKKSSFYHKLQLEMPGWETRGGWKSVLKVAPQCIAAVTFRYLSSKNRQVVSI